MKEILFTHRYVLAATAVLAAACSDTSGIVSPVLSPSSTRAVQFTAAPSGRGLATHAVTWGGSHAKGQYSASAFISAAAGGTISLPAADFSITFPPGALSSDNTITVVALPGQSVAYDLLPHGLRFSRPAVVSQGLLNTSAAVPGFSQALYAAYLADGHESISRAGVAFAAEIEVTTTTFSVAGVPVSQFWYLNHFSRYILASGVTEVGDASDAGL